MQKIFQFIFKVFAKLPLPLIHFLGASLGYLVTFLMPKFLHRIENNLRQSRFCSSEIQLQKLVKQNIKESGKAILETLLIWFRDYAKLKPLFRGCTGWHHVDAGLAKGKGLIFLTPHLGCFEITSLYYGQFQPITVLFRQPRQSWLLPLITAGRQRGQVTLAPANSQGVKQLLQALKRNEAIGILPDQAPLFGEGEWVPFFGRNAYTMTLASKLAQKTGAQVLMAFGERLSKGRGYIIHINSLPSGAIDSPTLLNGVIEAQISECPSQYLWMYDRYKIRQ